MRCTIFFASSLEQGSRGATFGAHLGGRTQRALLLLMYLRGVRQARCAWGNIHALHPCFTCISSLAGGEQPRSADKTSRRWASCFWNCFPVFMLSGWARAVLGMVRALWGPPEQFQIRPPTWRLVRARLITFRTGMVTLYHTAEDGRCRKATISSVCSVGAHAGDASTAATISTAPLLVEPLQTKEVGNAHHTLAQHSRLVTHLRLVVAVLQTRCLYGVGATYRLRPRHPLRALLLVLSSAGCPDRLWPLALTLCQQSAASAGVPTSPLLLRSSTPGRLAPAPTWPLELVTTNQWLEASTATPLTRGQQLVRQCLTGTAWASGSS